MYQKNRNGKPNTVICHCLGAHETSMVRFDGGSTYWQKEHLFPRNLPRKRTHGMNPEKTWVSISSNNFLGGPLVRSQSIFHGLLERKKIWKGETCCWWFRNPAFTSWYYKISLYLQGFILVMWCRISYINSIVMSRLKFWKMRCSINRKGWSCIMRMYWSWRRKSTLDVLKLNMFFFSEPISLEELPGNYLQFSH